MKRLEPALDRLDALSGSDLHYKANVPVYIRVGGELRRQDDLPRPDDEELRSVLQTVLDHRADARLRHHQDVVSTWTRPDGRRYRVSTLFQRGSPGLVLRRLPSQAPLADELGLGEIVRSFVKLRRGLVILAGPTRSGKTTTMASLVREYAERSPLRVVTVEDPVEYRIPSGSGLVSQRQVGSDTETFATGIESARRLDPDVVMLGELPDAEAAFKVLSLASSGPLVYLVVAASSLTRALEQIVEIFPSSRHEAVLARISIALRAGLCQTLLPRADGKGRVPALELMVPDAEIRQRVKSGAFDGIEDLLERMKGCLGFRGSAERLVQQGLVTKDEVARHLPPGSSGPAT